MIYTGGGVVQGNASAQLTELAHILGFPVTNTLMGLGAFQVMIHSLLVCWDAWYL
jgi:acetolactate synthase-1/2/3 large subunit